MLAGEDGIFKGKPSFAVLFDEADGNVLRRVGVFEQVRSDVVEDVADVLLFYGEGVVLLAQLEGAGKAPLLQLAHHLGQRLLEYLGEAGRRVEDGHGVPGDEGVFEEVVRQLLELAGLGVYLGKVIFGLRRRLIFAVAKDLGVEQQGGQGRTEVVAHLGDKVLHLGGGRRLVLVLLAEGETHGVEAGRQRRQLVAALHRDGVVEVAALHGLDLFTELDDVLHDAPAPPEEKEGEGCEADDEQEITAGAVVGVETVVVEQGRDLTVREVQGVDGRPVVEGAVLVTVGQLRGLRVVVLVVVAGGVGRIDELLVAVKLQQVIAMAPRPVGELFDVCAGKGIFGDIVLQLVDLILGSFGLNFGLVEIKTEALVQHYLQKAQQQKACQSRQDDEPGELFRQTVLFRCCHCRPPAPQSGSLCPRQCRCAEDSEGYALLSSADCGYAP